MNRPYLSALVVLFLFFLSSCAPGETTLQILDSATEAPIEGALVFAPEHPHTFRSDIRGRVTLPADYPRSLLRIWSKNYRPHDITSEDGAGIVRMRFDSTLVSPREREMTFTKKDSLRGSYGPYRENNDLLTYALSVRLDIEQKHLIGSNTITFRMLEDGDRIQLDLFDNMNVDRIDFGGEELSYDREFNAVFVDFPRTLTKGSIYSIDFHYSGHPMETGRFGGLSFKEDSLGNPWVFTANQGIGASLWWPNKDQQRDEVDSMTIRVEVPSDLIDVSNGRFLGSEDLGDGYTAYDWKVHYPINNYSVSLNIATYTHFADSLGELSMDFYVLPYHLEQARRQFAQAKPMLECFESRFGDYPFPKDGYKLVEVPYSGMEHQSAVTYGNLFKNGYLGRDWTGVDVSTRFDFIIVHESAHEWFGNSVTARDVSDAWIHEAWGTYAEAVYVECMFGYEDAMKYVNGYQAKVGNREPIIGPTGVNHWPTGDQYFKGALFLNTLRHVVDDDEMWWSLVGDYTEYFKHREIWTTDVLDYFNDYLDINLRSVFLQYLYHPSLPVLEYKFVGDDVYYRWSADIEEFDMPVKVRTGGEMYFIYPSAGWKSEPHSGGADNWEVATDLFYVGTQEVEQEIQGVTRISDRLQSLE